MVYTRKQFIIRSDNQGILVKASRRQYCRTCRYMRKLDRRYHPGIESKKRLEQLVRKYRVIFWLELFDAPIVLVDGTQEINVT